MKIFLFLLTFTLPLFLGGKTIHALESKKLLYVNSYHKGYEWSDEIEKGLLKSLNITEQPDGAYDTSLSEVEFQLFRMDTKNNTSEAFKKKAALEAKAIIDEWQPDIVVTSDDNAAKYLIVPYYKNNSIPFVFCAINWDVSDYGFPAPNITGMIEIDPIFETITLLKKYAKGSRIAIIGADTLSGRKIINHYKEKLGIIFTDGKLVSSFDEWQAEYLRLQNSVDMIVWLSPIGIKGWNDSLAREIIIANTKIPTGAISDEQGLYALLGRVKFGTEQGWWAGKTALKILGGTDPADIPITTNKESRIFLNMDLAKRLKIKFPMELLEKAKLIESFSD